MHSLERVLQDIESLAGMLLKSIRPGASLTVQEVDYDQKRVVVKTENGTTRSRSFSELETIVSLLVRDKIVHVESALKGSGSSRNQPETILANLPYIEFTYINRKKHLVLRPSNSHDIGTLREMDLLEADLMLKELSERKVSLPQQIVFVADLKVALDNLKQLGAKYSALNQSTYAVQLDGKTIWLTRALDEKDTALGAFILVDTPPSENAVFVTELQGLSMFAEPGTHVLTIKRG